MPPAARLGDWVNCAIHGPNPIITGSPNTFFGGPPVARHGDMTACGARIVVSGPRHFLVDGSPVARVGDLLDHGGMVVTGSPTIEVGDQGFSMVVALTPVPLHNRDWQWVTDRNFRTLPPAPIDPLTLTPEQKGVMDFLTAQGRSGDIIDQIMDSSRDYKITALTRLQILFSFTTVGYSKDATNAYWMEEEVFRTIEAEFCKNGIWDRQGVKDRLAIPCKNRANALVTAVVLMDGQALSATINPAIEDTYYADASGQTTQVVSFMPGGGRQITPHPREIGRIEVRNL